MISALLRQSPEYKKNEPSTELIYSFNRGFVLFVIWTSHCEMILLLCGKPTLFGSLCVYKITRGPYFCKTAESLNFRMKSWE